MYKDRQRQKEASKERMRRYRQKKGVTGVTTKGVTEQGVTVTPESNAPVMGTVTPEGIKAEVPVNYGQPDCQCMQCQARRRVPGALAYYNHGAYKMADQLGQWELNRMALPGDVDYQARAS